MVALASTGGLDDRFATGGQVDVVLRFIKLMQLGAYEAGLELADDTWLTCRVQGWLWNNHVEQRQDPEALTQTMSTMMTSRGTDSTWQAFVLDESHQFAEAWGDMDLDEYGAASRRRRLSADHDMVVISPVGASGGFYVTTATALPNALVFIVSRHENTWRICNHIGYAPPIAGWPPTWWITNDEAIDDLPEP